MTNWTLLTNPQVADCLEIASLSSITLPQKQSPPTCSYLYQPLTTWSYFTLPRPSTLLLIFFFLIPLPWQRRKEVQALLSNKPSSHFIEAWKATSIIWFSLGRRDKKKKKTVKKKNGKRHMAPSGLASYQNCVLLLAIT